MTIFTANLTTEQETQLRTFGELWSSTSLSSANLTVLGDAMTYGSLAEVSLSTTRYEVDVLSATGELAGKIIYEGSGFITSSWDGNPATLTPDMFGINSVLTAIRLQDANGVELMAYVGSVSGIQMVGSDTQAGSFTLNEFRVGSAAAGAYITLKGDLTISLATTDATHATVSGSVTELTLYARNGAEAYQFSITGNLSPSGTFTENLDGSISQVTGGLTGGITGISFQHVTYADAGSLTETGRADIVSVTGLNLDASALQTIAMATEGDFVYDTAFGTDGTATVSATAAGFENLGAMAQQGDGKVLLAGNSVTLDAFNNPSTTFTLSRTNADGTLDTSFGSNGTVTYDAGAGWSQVLGVEVQSDGHILVGASQNTDNTLVALRYNSDGTPDTTFSGDGIATYQAGGPANDMAVLADGSLLFVWSNFHFVRFDTSGNVDTNFITDAVVSNLLGSSVGQRITVQADGKILVAGQVYNGSDWDTTLVRLNSNGTLDTAFATNGIYRSNNYGLNESVADILTLTDGSTLLLTHQDYGSGSYTRVLKIDANGQPDGTFNGFIPNANTAWSWPNAMALEADGGIAVLTNGNRIVRLDSHGQVQEQATLSNYGVDLLAQPDGTLLLGGSQSNDLMLARLMDSTTALNQIFFDGDDTISLTTDTSVTLTGYNGNDSIITGSGNDHVYGDAGNDTLSTGAGNDYLIGGLGNDTLTGGAGTDKFIVAPDGSIDIVTDFTATDDKLVITSTQVGDFVADVDARFYAGTAAHDADDRIIYNQATGTVYYDADGTGAAAQVQIATLSNTPTLTGANFIIDTGVPILGADSATTNENDPVTIDIGANDYLPEGWSYVTANVTSGNGTASINEAGQVVFTPDDSYQSLIEGEVENAAVLYAASNGKGEFSTATVSITINGHNTAPIWNPAPLDGLANYSILATGSGGGGADLIEVSSDRQTVYYSVPVYEGGSGPYYWYAHAISLYLPTGATVDLGRVGDTWRPAIWDNPVTPDQDTSIARVNAAGYLEVKSTTGWIALDKLSYIGPNAINKGSQFSISPDGQLVAYISLGIADWDRALKVYDRLTGITREISTVQPVSPDAGSPLRASDPYFIDNDTLVVELPGSGVVAIDLTAGAAGASELHDAIAFQGVPFSYSITNGQFTDPDTTNDSITYSAQLVDAAGNPVGDGSLPIWLTFNPDSMGFSGTPDGGIDDTIHVSLKATDNHGAESVGQIFTLTIAGAAAIEQGSSFQFVAPGSSLEDAGSGVVVYKASLADGRNLPSWLAFDPVTRTFSGTPGNADVGSVSLRIVAQDASGATDTYGFSFDVANVNDAPAITMKYGDPSVIVPNYSGNGVLGADGSHVAYVVPAGASWGASSDRDHIVVHDMVSGQDSVYVLSETDPLSSAILRVGGNHALTGLSSDGSHALIRTWNGDFVESGTTYVQGVYYVGLATMAFQRIDVLLDGSEITSENTGWTPESIALSGNERYVAFIRHEYDPAYSQATDWWQHQLDHVYVKDLQTGSLTRADLTATGVSLVGSAGSVSISDDGRYVAFQSDVALTPDDVDDPFMESWRRSDIFVKDLQTGDIERINEDASGTKVSLQFGTTPVISGNGRYIAFATGDALAVNDLNGTVDIYVKDLLTGQIALASVGEDGNAGSGIYCDIDTSGRYVTYQTYAFSPDHVTVYVRDMVLGTSSRVPDYLPSAYGDWPHDANAVISSDGRVVAISSGNTYSADDLYPGSDWYVFNAVGLVTQNVTENDAFNFVIATTHFNDPDGDTLIYTATLSDGSALPAWLTFDPATRTFSGTPTNASAGNYSVCVTVTDPFGASTNDIFTLTVQDNGAPNNLHTGSITISGTATEGQTLTATNNLADADGLGTISYQWQRSTDNGNTWDSIASATNGSTYTLGDTDVGTKVRVVASYTDGQGFFETATGDPTDTVGMFDTGTPGNDILHGSTAADSLVGGLGNDTYFIDDPLDVVVENAGEGQDTVIATVSATLVANTETLVLFSPTQGGNGSFASPSPGPGISGSGNGEANLLIGTAAANRLAGGTGDDAIYAGAGNDLLIGGVGSDLLSGGIGQDLFAFDSLTGIDRITDFSAEDQLWFDDAIFTGLTAGPLSASAFSEGAGRISAQTLTERLIYNTDTGALYYDADGVGGTDALHVAWLMSDINSTPTLLYSQVMVV